MAIKAPLFTYADLAQLPDDGKRYELADGELIVSPAPTTDHQGISARFNNFLFRAEEKGFGRMFAAPTEVYFGRYRVVQPDLLFIRNERLDIITSKNILGAPDLVVEILSPGTRENDLCWKMTLYAREGVSYYWIVDPMTEAVLPHTLDGEGYLAASPLQGRDLLGCPLFPGVTIRVGRLFPSVPGSIRRRR